jgi:hypothetical protein
MKNTFCFLLILLYCSTSNAQTWTEKQRAKANTAKDIAYLTTVEKECIMYINLCRMYPKEFLKNELLNYFGTKKYGDYIKDSEYRKSLISYLETLPALEPLYFDPDLYKIANCFAKEQGIAGTTGHKRIKCALNTYAAECCSYGMDTGKDIAMQLLIDHDVPSLGHRKNCLNKYSKIGVSVQMHKKWDVCAVVDLK